MDTEATISPAVAQTSELLIAVLRATLIEVPLTSEQKEKLTPEMLSALYRLADAHDLAHMVAMCLRKEGLLTAGEVVEKYRQREFLALYRHEQMAYAYAELSDALSAQDIPYIPLKGTVLRPYYPQSSMRTSSDIDLFLREEDLARTGTLLQEQLGYRFVKRHLSEVTYASPAEVTLELHYYDGTYSSDDCAVFQDVFTRTVPALGSRHDLSDADFMLYYINHMAKHFRHGGCGVRPFMDLWVMEKRMGLSRTCADRELLQHGLLAFAKGAFALADAWFDGASHTDLTRDMSAYILTGGVYGTRQNASSAQRAITGSRFGNLMRRVFLPYRILCCYFPSLRRFPFLYPFYHIPRWIQVIRRRDVRFIARTVKTDLAPNSEKDVAVATLFSELELTEASENAR